jgi:hypothetical protein
LEATNDSGVVALIEDEKNSLPTFIVQNEDQDKKKKQKKVSLV